MIKSDSGTIEVDGIMPAIMAEFETILVTMRNFLGEEKYNLVLQRANEKELSEKSKETLRKCIAEAIEDALSESED